MSLEIDSILKKALKKSTSDEKPKTERGQDKLQYTEPKTTDAGIPTITEGTVTTEVKTHEVEQTIEMPPTPLSVEPKPVQTTDVKVNVNVVPTDKITLPSHEEEGLRKAEELGILEEDVPAPPKLIITIYGEKGTGKTTTALSFRERVAAFSFDDKTTIIKANMYKGDPRIKVFVPVRYWDKSDKNKIPESAKRVWNMMLKTLDWLRDNWRPDWIVVDAVEVLEKLIEQVMRHDFNVGPYDGIANRNVWKYRKDLFETFLNKAKEVAKYGVIFTTYPEYSEHISQGEIVNRKQVPKWADYLQLVTDIVLYTYVDDRTNEFKVKVITSKIDEFLPSGKTYTVTGSNLWDVAKLGEKIHKLNAFLSRK